MTGFNSANLEQLFWGVGPTQVSDLLQKIDQSGNITHFFGRLLWEYNYPPSNEFQNFLNALGSRKIQLVMFLNKHFRGSDLQRNILLNNGICIFVDFFQWRVYSEIIIKKKNSVNSIYNPSSKTFLFLTGKPHRINRIGLLWYLSQGNLLDLCQNSLYVQDIDRPRVREILESLGSTEPDRFIDANINNPDGIAMRYWNDGSCHYRGIPYDPRLYAQNLFRLISESSFHHQANGPWITEKTWLTICNHSAFIMAGDVGTLADLESRGFRTFKEHLAVPDYDQISNASLRMEAIVKNTQHWLTTQLDHDKIQKDISHNYQNFLSEAQMGLTKTKQDLAHHDIHIPFDQLVPTGDFYETGII